MMVFSSRAIIVGCRAIWSNAGAGEKDAADWGGAHIDGGDDEELLFDTHHRRGYSGGVQRPAETVSD